MCQIVIDSQDIVKYASMSHTGKEMDQMIEPESTGRISKDHYLSRLSEVDRDNLASLGKLFGQTLQAEGSEGMLVTVGSTITKPLPRKDIDLVIVLRRKISDPDRTNFPTAYDYALYNFRRVRDIVEKMISQEPRFRIDTATEPVIDEEFGNPAILKNAGTITLIDQNKQATPIEFLSTAPIDSLSQFEISKTKPAVILTQAVSNEVHRVLPIPIVHNPQALERWIQEHINAIPKGYEDLKHEDQTPYAKEEQLQAYRQQILDVVKFKQTQKNYKPEEVIKMLMNLASGN